MTRGKGVIKCEVSYFTLSNFQWKIICVFPNDGIGGQGQKNRGGEKS